MAWIKNIKLTDTALDHIHKAKKVDNGLSYSNSPSLQHELYGVKATSYIDSKGSEVKHVNDYILRRGKKARRGSNGGGGGANMNRNHLVPRSKAQSKLTKSFGVTVMIK
ncbi:hypothetical protein CTI12_AA496050 [Artemisia annua]|uniref:Uncharacterized protein n=1 Tax=Artemisia annua TaxID=35608 RepID=A0A2U1LF79_ARTAN|nr:hypothetical protein CTI12_AA496050 [Artemisia annua]